MKKSKVILLKTLSALLAIGLVYFLFSKLTFLDFGISLIPGWHTTIMPFWGVFQTIVSLLLFAGFAWLVYRLIWRVFSKLGL